MHVRGVRVACAGRIRVAVVSTVAATWSGAGEGEQLWFLGTLAIVRVAGEASGGRFALIEFLFPWNASPPLHTHPQDESYIVQEGRLTLQAGEQRFELVAGGQPSCRWGSRTPSAWTAKVRGCSCSVRRQGLSVSYATGQSLLRGRQCRRAR